MNEQLLIATTFALAFGLVALGYFLRGNPRGGGQSKSCKEAATKSDLEEMEKRIMASQAELAADLKAVLAQQQKTAVEIKSVQDSVDALKTKVAELEAVIAAGPAVSQELADAVAAVKAQAQLVDELIPDLPVTEPPTT